MNICRPLMTSQCLILALAACASADDGVNRLTSDEKAAGFELIFDGTDFEGWKHSGNWKLEDGTMTRAGRGGSNVYIARKIPNNFELRFEWKVAAGSNSGVYYRPGQYEYQILDNSKHADGQNPRTSAASLYFCMAPSHDATKPVGEWNQGRIVCHDSVIQHWLNGQKVIDFDYRSDKWQSNVEMLRQRGARLRDRGAHLSLQDHGDPVWYRSIKLRELPTDFILERSPVKPAQIPPDVLKKEAEKLERIVKSRQKRAQNK